MLEGLLRHTNTVQRVVVQWGTEQEVVQWGTEQVVVLQEDKGLGVAECTRVVLQEDKGLGIAECTRVVLQEDKGLGVAEGRTWDMELGVVEGRMWDTGLGVAEDRMYGTGGQYIVQSGRQLLVAYFEGGPVGNSGVFDPWVAAQDRLYFVYLT